MMGMSYYSSKWGWWFCGIDSHYYPPMCRALLSLYTLSSQLEAHTCFCCRLSSLLFYFLFRTKITLLREWVSDDKNPRSEIRAAETRHELFLFDCVCVWWEREKRVQKVFFFFLTHARPCMSIFIDLYPKLHTHTSQTKKSPGTTRIRGRDEYRATRPYFYTWMRT